MSGNQPVQFGKYLLLERIGIGGMAEVFKAKLVGAEGFERVVAIKRILPHLVEDDDFVKMFVDEAKIAVRLNHPNIVAIHDLGKAGGTLFIGMEYVLGRDLRAIYDYEAARGGRTPVGIATHVVMKMCEALHHAHFATGPRGEPLQVIHRDVSPQNVMVSFDGEVKVADFGLAKARGRMVQTQAGVVKGKLAYMSPEQLRGEEIDHRVDVFGLGIVLFELLAGQRLFMGPSDMDTLRRVYEAHVPPLRELNQEVHADLEAIVRKALAKERDERYGTALELHDDLQSFVYGHGCYAGASSLRTYMAQAFPDAAPAAPGMPPFAPSAPPSTPPRPQLEPRPTHRPPALGPRDEIPPPTSHPDEHGAETSASLRFDESTNDENTFDLDADVDAGLDASLSEILGDAIDEYPTDRPPQPPDVVTHRVIQTGRPPAHSGMHVPARGLPNMPAGIYDESAAALDERNDQRADHRAEPGHDTSPAPAPEGDLPGFSVDDWGDDEATVYTPDISQKRPTPQFSISPELDGSGDEDPFDGDDVTVIVDPRNNTA